MTNAFISIGVAHPGLESLGHFRQPDRESLPGFLWPRCLHHVRARLMQIKGIKKKISFSCWQINWNERSWDLKHFHRNSLCFKFRKQWSGTYTFLESYIDVSVTALSGNVLNMLFSSVSHRYCINMYLVMWNIIFKVWNRYFIT